MIEFFKEYYDLITTLVEFTAAFTGVLMYKKHKNSIGKYLVFFLIYAFFVDLIGGYPEYLYNWGFYSLIENTLIVENYWWYTIFWWIGLATFITFINYKILEKSIYKKVIKYLYIVYIIQAIMYGIINFKKLFQPLDTFLAIASVWMISVVIIIYFLEILQSNRIVYFYKSLQFYINSAVLIWTITVTPIVFYEVYFDSGDWNYVILKWQILLSINIIFYFTLTLALIFCKPQIK